MIAARIFRLLLVALSILATAEALSPRERLVAEVRDALNIRQGGTNANTNGDTTTSPTSQKTPTPNTTPTDTTGTATTPATTPTQDTTPTQTQTQTTPTNTQTKTTPTNTHTQTQTTPTQTATNTSPTTTGNGNPQTTSSPTSSTVQTTPTTITTFVVLTTTSNGVAQVVTSSTTSVGLATLSASPDDNANQGMSSQTKTTIIGVVVGVGGAIILAVVGLIWWRVWGRKKDNEENDGLMGYGGYTAGAAEKPESLTGGHGTMGSGSSRTPFQSTLESYHAPTQVNQASNF